MATRFMYKALVTAALGIALSPLLAAATAPSSASSNTAGALQLDPPAAPSSCRARTFYDPRWEYFVVVTWSDNSTSEDGFTIEEWYRNPSGVWNLAGTVNKAANSTAASFYFLRRPTADFKFRVKAFNASGDSSWSNWAH